LGTISGRSLSILRVPINHFSSSISNAGDIYFATFHHISNLVNIFDWLSTEWAVVFTFTNPSDNALTVEVMSFVTFQLGDLVLCVIFHQADLAFIFEFKFVWIKWSSVKLFDDLWDLAVLKTIGASHLLFLNVHDV